jgi:tetraacyldisaccharide 4'-kinase
LINTVGQRQPVGAVTGQRIAAFCGIGNPAAFRRTLESAGGEIVWWREFPDHHAFSKVDQEEIAAAASASGAELIVSTRKDLVKLPVEQLGGRPLWALAIEMQLVAGQAELESALATVLTSSR